MLEMLEKILDVMDKRTALENKEMGSKPAFDVIVIAFKGQIKQTERDLPVKKALRAQATSTMSEDKQYPANVVAEEFKELTDAGAALRRHGCRFELAEPRHDTSITEEIAELTKAIADLDAAVEGSRSRPHGCRR